MIFLNLGGRITDKYQTPESHLEKIPPCIYVILAVSALACPLQIFTIFESMGKKLIFVNVLIFSIIIIINKGRYLWRSVTKGNFCESQLHPLSTGKIWLGIYFGKKSYVTLAKLHKLMYILFFPGY